MYRLMIVGSLTAAAVMAADPSTAPPTFTKDIAPIFQAKCEECHRKDTAAPMSLITYQEARPWAKSIKERVVSRNMPPWHLDKGVGIQHYANDRSLTDGQINTIARWVDAGAPQGDPKEMPAAKVWPTDNGWETSKILGEPTFVVKSAEYTMPAQGQDVWFKPVSALPIDEERWVRAVEIRPATLAGRKISHHVRADLVMDELPNGRGGNDAALMEWAIGKQNDVYREGAGKPLEPGARIRWEMHLHAVGEPVTTHVELGVWLYPKGTVPAHKTVLTNFPATNGPIDLPPNQVTMQSHSTVLKSNARLENFQPHMHLRGKAMLMEATLPDGTTQVLSYVNNFNFNWMNNYIYADDSAPVLPKGTVIRITSWHDNTSANRFNPDPNQWVGNGDRTIDEMSFAWVNVTNLTDEEYNQWVASHKPAQSADARTGDR
jgi:hypothetical protein